MASPCRLARTFCRDQRIAFRDRSPMRRIICDAMLAGQLTLSLSNLGAMHVMKAQPAATRIRHCLRGSVSTGAGAACDIEYGEQAGQLLRPTRLLPRTSLKSSNHGQQGSLIEEQRDMSGRQVPGDVI